MSRHQFSAQIERDRATGYISLMCLALPDAHTQAKSLDELQVKLKEVIEL